MTTTKVLEIKGFDELMKALKEAPEKALPLAEEAMGNSLALLQDRLAGYPATTEANQAGRWSLKTHRPMGYYQRGAGWWYPTKRTPGGKLGKRLGAIRAPKQVAEVGGYKLRRISKRLGTKWKMQTTAGEGFVQGEIGTTVSYAEYVQGDRQSRVHASRDWVTASQALEESTEEILGFFEEAVGKLAEELGG